MGEDADTAVAHGEHGRIFVIVGEVLGHVFDHEALGIFLEVRVDEAAGC